MSEERIIISFDDDNPEPEGKKIEIDINKQEEKTPDLPQPVKKKNSFYKNNPSLTNFSESELKFPEGIDSGFRKIYSVEIKDIFLNSLLEFDNSILLSSQSGSVYFLDALNGNIISKHTFTGESFEKTGFVYEDIAFINSLTTVFKFTDTNNYQQIYTTQEGYYIWSNLNLIHNQITFIEYF